MRDFRQQQGKTKKQQQLQQYISQNDNQIQRIELYENWFNDNNDNLNNTWTIEEDELNLEHEDQLEQFYENFQNNSTQQHNFRQIEPTYQYFKPRRTLSEIQNKKIAAMNQQEQIKGFKNRRLNVLTQQKSKYFQPHERKAPYRQNVRRDLSEMRKFYSNGRNVCLSYNKYPPDFVAAVLLTEFDGHQPHDQKLLQGLKKLQSLYMTWARTSKVIIYLQNRPFQSLKVLNIGGNNVQSIQQFCRIEMPQVQDILLQNNNIMEVRSLRRGYFPKLSSLDIHANKICQLTSLRCIGTPFIYNVILDTTKINNINEAILMVSKSPKAKVSVMSCLMVRFVGRPYIRRRKKAIQIQPCSLKVRYL